MSEMPDPPAGGAPAGHAGALIRAARLSRGWSVSHLAMLHKLTERRLEALEEGRFSDVGDATFVRALVRSLCRHLGVDPQPVLDALPPSLHSTTPPMPLPVRAEVRPTDATRIPAGKGDVIGAGSWVPRPVLIGVGAILACALLLALLPYLESLSPVARAPEAAASGGWSRRLRPRLPARSPRTPRPPPVRLRPLSHRRMPHRVRPRQRRCSPAPALRPAVGWRQAPPRGPQAERPRMLRPRR